MNFLTRSEVAARFAGKTVAVVGSGPGCLQNAPGFIDSHDIVVRVNNYKLFDATGERTDVHYSFYGHSIKKTAAELRADGVKLCLCKCPDAQFMESHWHRRRHKMNGVDFRYIYAARKNFWFCDTYIPTVDEFLQHFNLLQRHVPTTGFAAILDVLSFNPAHVYLTGFDFFMSGVHNVNEPWRRLNPSDPIGHRPLLELQWLARNARAYPIAYDSIIDNTLREFGGKQLRQAAVPA